MVRFFAMSLAVLLTTQAAPAFAQSINFAAQLSNGAQVQAVCSAHKGEFSGTGVLFGTNPANGNMYKYPFIIRQGSTSPGQIRVAGVFADTNYPVTLTASVPNGTVTFSYIVNGKTYTLTGTGTVTVK